MKESTTFLMSSALLICAAHAQEYRRRDFAEWKERTQAKMTTDDRLEAIGALQCIAVAHIDLETFHRRRDEGISWVAKEITSRMVELLDDKDPRVRDQAANAMCSFPKKAEAAKAAIPRLMELFADPDDGVRRSAVGFFVFLGPAAEPAVPALIKVLKEERLADVRYDAACALRTTGLKAQQALMAMLDDPNVEVRRAVVRSLAFHYMDTVPQEPLQQAAPKLKELLHDDDAEVRRGAADALRFQSPQFAGAVPALTQSLRDKDKNVRHAAAINLLEMGEAAKPSLPEIIKLAGDDDKLFRRSLTINLSRVGPESIPALTKLLEDKDANVRAYAADGLGKFGPAAKDAVPTLKRLLTDMDKVYDLQGCVCNHAGEALAKILGDKKYLDGLPPMPEDGK